MFPRLFHIYGPLWIYGFGVMIALGLLAFLLASYNHPVRKRIVSGDTYLNLVFLGLFIGLLGGRILFVLTMWQEFSGNLLDIFCPWIGGLVILGGLVAVVLFMPVYLWYRKIPILPLLDLAALHGPLFEGVSRLGCLLSGCCYGIEAPLLPWAITFTDPSGVAPLHVALHPTQIYMSLLFFMIFIIFKVLVRYVKVKPGQILFLYLMTENTVRFSIDFIRGDRGTPVVPALSLSAFQIQSLSVLAVSIIGFILVTFVSKKPAQRFE